MPQMSTLSHGRNRKSRPASRLAKIIGGLVAILMGWQVIDISLAASHGDRSTTPNAADYGTKSQAAANVAAQQRLEDNDPAGAAVLASRVLASSPISAAAVRVLGIAKQQLGDWRASNAIMGQAGALGWRDAPTQLWLASVALQSKDYEGAANRMDAVLRANPANPAVQQALDSVLSDPAFVKAMAARMQVDGKWRKSYFLNASAISPPEIAARAALLEALIPTKAPPARDELASVENKLAYIKDTPRARALWFAANHMPETLLYDAGFERTQPADANMFEWLIGSVMGADLSVSSGDSGQSKRIVAKTDGTANGRMIQQWTSLPEGPHRFSILAAGNPATLSAFRWAIGCGSNGKRLLTLQPMPGRASAEFVVPANDCSRQLVFLQVQPSTGAVGAQVAFQSPMIE